jgi:hypothetical protein
MWLAFMWPPGKVLFLLSFVAWALFLILSAIFKNRVLRAFALGIGVVFCLCVLAPMALELFRTGQLRFSRGREPYSLGGGLVILSLSAAFFVYVLKGFHSPTRSEAILGGLLGFAMYGTMYALERT